MPKKQDFDPGPPMASRLGMSDDWMITAWDEENGGWVHFFCVKKRVQWDVYELSRDDLELSKVENPHATKAPTKNTPTLRVKSIDVAVEKIEDLLDPDDGGGDDDDGDDDDEEPAPPTVPPPRPRKPVPAPIVFSTEELIRPPEPNAAKIKEIVKDLQTKGRSAVVPQAIEALKALGAQHPKGERIAAGKPGAVSWFAGHVLQTLEGQHWLEMHRIFTDAESYL